MKSTILKLLNVSHIPASTTFDVVTPNDQTVKVTRQLEIIEVSFQDSLRLKFLDLGFKEWAPIGIESRDASLCSAVCINGYWTFDYERTQALRLISERLASDLWSE